jgi:chitinase
MTAFTEETGPEIWAPVDYINIMAYDLMNRRDQVTDHHTSVEGAKEAVENYLAISAPPEKINLGFAFYAKYFTTAGACGASALGCAVVSAEDSNGDDTHKSGAWTFEKAHMAPYDKSAIKPSYDGKCGADVMTSCSTGCCSQYGNCGVTPEHCSGGCQHDFGTGCTDPDVFGSWQKALKKGVTDEQAGGEYYFDDDQKLFWTWDTPALIERKFTEIVDEYELGGVMAWSLGEDSYDWSHIKEISSEVAKRSAVAEHSVEVERPDQPVSPESVELEELTEPQEPTEPSESTELPEPTEFPEEFPEHIGHAGHAGRPTYTERPEYTSRPKLLERPVYSTRLERPERPKRPEIPKRPQRPVDPELQADTEELSGGRNAAPEDDGEEWGTERQGWEWFGK